MTMRNQQLMSNPLQLSPAHEYCTKPLFLLPTNGTIGCNKYINSRFLVFCHSSGGHTWIIYTLLVTFFTQFKPHPFLMTAMMVIHFSDSKWLNK